MLVTRGERGTPLAFWPLEEPSKHNGNHMQINVREKKVALFKFVRRFFLVRGGMRKLW